MLDTEKQNPGMCFESQEVRSGGTGCPTVVRF